MIRIHLDHIRDRLRSGAPYSLRGIVLSAILHLMVITFPGSTQPVKLPNTPDSQPKTGQSLLNSIWYDLYNCRTGSEELLLYLSRYHPELELGTVRGSVLRYDGTLMGHMDPAVKINGRWLVLKTVALDTLLVEEYRIGELYPLKKIVLRGVRGSQVRLT